MSETLGLSVNAEKEAPQQANKEAIAQKTEAHIAAQIATELGCKTAQAQATIAMLDAGATVPFIARYRKEATGGLDDTQLRLLDERLSYLRELEARRATILQSIAEQGKLSAELHSAIAAAATKQALEDLYLPFKPKRRTKAMIAREAGLEPLADALLDNPQLEPEQAAQDYVLSPERDAAKIPEGADFSSVAAVLDGVRDILSERWAEDAAVVHSLREWLWEEGQLQSKKRDTASETDAQVAKLRDYFDYTEAISSVPSHRALAVLRGRNAAILDIKILTPDEAAAAHAADLDPKGEKGQNLKGHKILPTQPGLAEGRIGQKIGWKNQGRPADALLGKCVAWAWKVKLSLSLERDLLSRLREQAERTAIGVFARNLRDLLLSAPAGSKTVLGLDPGIRTGVKVAVVDGTGKVLDTSTVYPHEPRRDWEGALHTLAQLCAKHGVQLIAIGNGTASRETDQLAAELIQRLQASGHAAVHKLVVSEAGASVYSASAFAAAELPQLDVSLRGAVSIARRVQDPLAELVKIDPKAIGVGQYQHDLSQPELAKSLDAVVEDCVNAVGVDVNTASTALLMRVAGLSSTVAQAIVVKREQDGAFCSRQELRKVHGLGPKTFEQCAGFLRIRAGSNPLDMTAVHPESYPVVEKMLAALRLPIASLMGQSDVLRRLQPAQFASAEVGEITVSDILKELEKPGRDPRPDFKVARFNEGVAELKDLRPGMVLEGTVSNVAAFGAFVDIGVHQDGLVHISQLADSYVQDPHKVVKTGDIVQVRVLEVDLARKRVSLSMRRDAPNSGYDTTRKDSPQNRPGAAGRNFAKQVSSPPSTSAMENAFAKLKNLQK